MLRVEYLENRKNADGIVLDKYIVVYKLYIIYYIL